MPDVISTICASEAKALDRGPIYGVAGQLASGALRVLADKATVPVGAPAVSTSNAIKFGILKKGSRIMPALTSLVTDHSAAITGSLKFVPLDSSGVISITGVTIQTEAVNGGSIPDAADIAELAADCWVQFVPSADLTITGTAKNIWLRMVYSLGA